MRKKTREIPGQDARDASFHVRQNLHNAKMTDRSKNSGGRQEIGPAKSCLCKSSRSKVAAAFCFMSCGESSSLPLRSQVTHNIESFRGATSHGGSRKFLFPVVAERKDRSKIIRSRCLDLLKALAERFRTRGSSIAGREADRVDANQVRTKATHGTNAK